MFLWGIAISCLIELCSVWKVSPVWQLLWHCPLKENTRLLERLKLAPINTQSWEGVSSDLVMITIRPNWSHRSNMSVLVLDLADMRLSGPTSRPGKSWEECSWGEPCSSLLKQTLWISKARRKQLLYLRVVKRGIRTLWSLGAWISGLKREKTTLPLVIPWSLGIRTQPYEDEVRIQRRLLVPGGI